MSQYYSGLPLGGSASSGLPDRYLKISKLGEGTYGTVYKCSDTKTGRLVALKKIRIGEEDEGLPATAIREVSILLELSHPNVVALYETVCTDTQLCLVFEFMEQDLKMWVNSSLAGTCVKDLKRIVFQILLGLRYCHENRVLHRDLKPQNILVSHQGIVKLADFGLARAFAVPIKAYTKEVVTQWYRPAEILLGCKVYTPAVDVWSVGCIMGELFQKGEPLFPGNSEIDQLYKIFQLLGTPSPSVWASCQDLENYQTCFPSWKPKDLATHFPQLDGEGVVLLKGMLTYDPTLRISASAALESPWFDEIRQ